MFLLADSQLQPRSWQGSRLLHKTFPAFWLPKKRLRQQYAAYGLNMCHLSWWQLGPARVWHSCTMDNGWRKSEKSTFLYKKFHALCSEQKTWKLDQLTSIHPTDKLKACCSEVTLERYPKTPLSSWVQKVDWRNINKRCQEKKTSIYRNMCSNTFSTTTQPPLKWTSSPKFSKLVFNSYPVCFCVSTLWVYWGLVPHLPISSKALFHLMSNLPKKKHKMAMAQNYWQQECTIFYHIYPYLEVWRYDSQHDRICGPIVRNPNSEPHPNVKFSLTGARQIQNCTHCCAAWTRLGLKTNQLCKEPSKTETKKTQSCNEFEQTTKPFLPACGLLMIHDIPADKWIFQTCLPLSMQTTHPVPLMQCWTFRGKKNISCDSSKQLWNESTSAFAMDFCAKYSWHWDVLFATVQRKHTATQAS